MSLPPLPFRTLNAFAPTPHAGNQAAVVVFEAASDPRAASDEYHRLVARDFNYAETAFLVPLDVRGAVPRYKLRWFTPAIEVDLCGHATLASASVAFDLHPDASTVEFETRSGTLTATLAGARGPGADIAISLPIPLLDAGGALHMHRLHTAGIDAATVVHSLPFPSTYGGTSCIIELSPDVDLAALKVDAKKMSDIVGGLAIVTQQVPAESSGSRLRINSRVFAHNAGIDEDPVTGAAHAMLTGYYNSSATTLPSNATLPVELDARQLSVRGGAMRCQLIDKRARLTGKVWETASGTLATFDLGNYQTK